MTRKDLRSHIRRHLVRLQNDITQDSRASVYTDTEINALIDEASKHFLEQTGILQGSETITVTAGSGTITGSVIKVDRVEIGSEPIGWIYKQAYDEDLPAI